MTSIYKLALFALCLLLSSTVVAQDCDSSCQLRQIQAYFSALDNISRNGSSIADIDALLALTHDEVNYIHVAYDANFNKDTWRKAFIRNLARGAYQNSEQNQLRITNKIFGNHYIAIEYSHGMIQADGSWQTIGNA